MIDLLLARGDLGSPADAAELVRYANDDHTGQRNTEQLEYEASDPEAAVKLERASSSEEVTNSELVEESRPDSESDSESDSVTDPNEEEKDDEQTLRKRARKALLKKERD
jgi:hypothetical protein